jgi:hypothetical protein
VWSIGWDHRSLILQVLDHGAWHSYRLPKASHSYDGAHGWNTEWPRIRDIGETDLLMTMHGSFWRFPKNFDSTHSAGIAPRSNYLKVVGDFARWNDRLVLGCDDTAQSEFLNKRRAKGQLAGPGQSQSNLWFIDPAQLDRFGPVLGRGAVWLDEPVKANAPSDAFLFAGYDHRLLHLAHDATEPITFTLEVDRAGNNSWTERSEERRRRNETSGGRKENLPKHYGPDVRQVHKRGVPVSQCLHHRNWDSKHKDGTLGPERKQVKAAAIVVRGHIKERAKEEHKRNHHDSCWTAFGFRLASM